MRRIPHIIRINRRRRFIQLQSTNNVSSRHLHTILRRLPPGHLSSVVHHQKRTIWPFSERQTKSSENQQQQQQQQNIRIQMPKRREKEEKEDDDKFKTEYQDILNAPVGTIQPTTWQGVERLIEHVSEKENISQSFRLLDRLILEPEANTKLSNESIYIVIQKWLTTSKQQDKPVFPPLKVWKRMEEYQKLGIPLESRTYHRMIEALAIGRYKRPNNQHGPIGPELAETILERMMELSKHRNPIVRPSTYTFNVVLSTWENAASTSSWAKHEAPQRTLNLFSRLKMLYETGWGAELMPDKNTYRRIMNIFAHKGDGEKVEALLEELYERYWEEDHHENLLPTTPFFSLVLYAWSKSKDPLAAERASVILDRMLELEANGDIPGLQVTAACFNIVMVCFSRQRTKESTLRVQSLFDQLVELSENDPVKKPIGGSYTALLTTWSHFDVAKAEEVFWMWKEEHDKGNCEMRMDAKLLGTLVAGWYKSGKHVHDSAERCDRLLQYALSADLKSFEPSVVVFNMTINAYCRKKSLEGVQRAEELLKQMDDYKEYFAPTIFSYVPIIHAWSSLGRVERAEEFLLEWYSGNNKDKKSSDSPSMKMKKRLDTQTFNHVLKAWLSKSTTIPHAASRAEELLLQMPQLGVRPNALSFQHVLECRQRARRNSKEEGRSNHDGGRSEEILLFLDQAFKNGSGISHESYLSMRKAWSLETL